MDEKEIGTAVASCDESFVSCDSSVFSVHDAVGKWFSHRGHRDHRGKDMIRVSEFLPLCPLRPLWQIPEF